ncbi:MAG: ABC transporter permease [Candidatus Doudnabacteria bacterium]|nr:ABC transporter permease [Candidatus Doudnabacteria bacterium]
MSNDQHNLGFSDLIRLSTRIFTVKPTRTLLTILGTSIGISTVVFLISLGYGLQYILLGKLITTQDSLVTLQATYPTEANIILTPDEVKNLSSFPNVTENSPVAEFPAEINSGLGSVVKIVEPNYFRLSGIIPDLGSPFTDGASGMVITSQAMRVIGLEPTEASLNKKVIVKVEYQEPDGKLIEIITTPEIPIVGIITDENEPPVAYFPPSYLKTPPPYYKEIFLKASALEAVEPLRDALLEKGLLISARIDLVNQAQKILNIITIVLGVFGIAALTVSAVGMFNTMIVSFLERTYEVGVMKSLGAMDSDVRNLFLMESAIMGFLGGLSGILMGIGAGELFNLGLNFLARRLGGEPINLFYTPLWFIMLVITSSTFIGLFAGFWPARRASGLSPKEAFLRK